MAATLTCTLAASDVPVIYHPNRTTTLAGQVAYSADYSASEGDTVLLAKIPHGAWIVAFEIDLGASDSGAEMNVGTSDDIDSLLTSASVSGTNRVFKTLDSGGINTLPIKVSVGDTARDQFVFLQTSIGAGQSSGSVSGTIVFMVQYTHQNPGA